MMVASGPVHYTAASIRNAKRLLFCRTVRCLLSTASMGGIGCVGRSPKGECRRTRRGAFQEGVTQESGCGRRGFCLPPKKQARHRHKPPSSLRCRAQHAHDRVRVPAKYRIPRQPCRYRIGIDGDCRCRPQAASLCAPAAGCRSSFAAVATAARSTATATARSSPVRPTCARPHSAIGAVAAAG
jgi:hypothetical protein